MLLGNPSLWHRLPFLVNLLVVALVSSGSECKSPPGSGPTGKILPFESTPLPLVEAMLALAHVDSSTVLVDLGCGDGRIARAAVRRGARRAVGVDIDEDLIRRARALTTESESKQLEFLVGDMTSGDMLNADFIAAATVVTLYWTPDVLRRHAQSVIDHLQEGTVVITHDYVIPEHSHVVEWFSELHQEKRSIIGDHVAYLYKYIVGARDSTRNHHRQTVRPQCSLPDGVLEFRLVGGFPIELRSHTIVYSHDCTLSQPTTRKGSLRDTSAVTLPVHLVVVDGHVKALWLQGAEQRQLAVAYQVTAAVVLPEAPVHASASSPHSTRVPLGAGSTRNPITGKIAENFGLRERVVPLNVTVTLRLQPSLGTRPKQKLDRRKDTDASTGEL